MFHIIDFKTKQPVKPKDFIFIGEQNEPWEVRVNIEAIKEKINFDYYKKSPPMLIKYLPFLPIQDYSQFVTLSEGATPLLKSRSIGKKLGAKLYFKYEAVNPTGSFKDRGSAIEVTVAKELGAKAIVVASTGNMAASCSCYAAAADIPCFVFVPEGTPVAKLAQVISYGGKIVQVKGKYSDAARIAKEIARKLGFYLAGDYAFRTEGQKTGAYEVIDQMFYHVPDMVIVPMGVGTNIAAYGKGFREYKELDFIDRIPQIIGVEAEGANAIVQSFMKKTTDIKPLETVNTIASAIAVDYPWDGIKALDVIQTSGGEAVSVSDTAIVEAQYMLAKEEGLFVESSAASSLSALFEIAKKQDIQGKKIVCVLTGNGLKDPMPIIKAALKPPTINPDAHSFLELYNNKFFDRDNIVCTGFIYETSTNQ